MNLRPHPVFVATALVLGAVGLGVGWHCGRESAPDPGAREVLPKSEYFGHARSFSELENARAELDATALRVLFELRRMRVEHRGRTDGSAPDAGLAKVIEVLEQGVEDLAGTEWELTATRDLLAALNQAGLSQRWLELYLGTLHRRPTADLAPSFAAEALRVGRSLGREEEAIAALHYVLANPQVTTGRDRIAALLHEPAAAVPRDGRRDR